MIEKLQKQLTSLESKTGHGCFEAGSIICNSRKVKKESVAIMTYNNKIHG